jgi:peptide/nickel transport system substrate-binding protein
MQGGSLVTDEAGSAAEFTRRQLLGKAGKIGLAGIALGGGIGLRTAFALAGSSAGGTVVEASLADPTTFNPLVGQDFAAYVVSGLVFDGLLSVDAHGNPIPAIAQALPTVTNGGTRYVFKLRPNAKWSDGKPLTADDVVFTYDLMFSPKYKAFSSAYRGDLTTHLKSVKALNSHTVEIVTKGVYAPFQVADCTLGLLPKHVLGSVSAAALNKHSFNQGPTVSNGVFKYVSRQQGSQITFARNPHYWAGPSKLDGYVLKIVPTSTSIAQQLKTGEIDIGPVTADQFSSLQSSSNVKLVTFPSLNVEVATFNLNSTSPASVIFADKQVRQALWWGLDRPAIIKAAFFGSGALFTNSVEPPGTWSHANTVTPDYSFDPTKAASLLDAAGWTKGSSGTRAKNGTDLAFTIMTLPSYQTAIEAMAAQWKSIGANVQTQITTIGVIVDQLFTTRTYDMIFIADNLLSADPDVSAYFASRNAVKGGLNSGGYKNPAMDAALAKSVGTLDQAKRKTYYAQIQNIFADDPPGIPMLDLVQAYGVSTKVTGAKFSTYNNFSPRPFMRGVTKA